MLRVLKTLVLAASFACFLVTATHAEYKLVWSDEFDKETLNLDNWEPMIGNGTEYGIPGWGNEELQYYTGRTKNVFLENGYLVINAFKEDFENCKYTSARLRTINKQDFLYGKIEARIKLPSGMGMWPAFWMLPTNSPYGDWPIGGEIDIFEAANENPDHVSGGIFFGGPWPEFEHIGKRSSQKEKALSDDFHIYTMEWQPYEIRWYLDGELFAALNYWRSYSAKDETGRPAQIHPYPAPFDSPFHILLNVAVGGGMTRVPPEEVTSEPARMDIDWVRVYQTENKPPLVTITSPKEGEKISKDKDILIDVDATDPDGQIKKVEFYAFDELIGEDTTAPYRLIWKAPDENYTILVKAWDNEDFVNFTSVNFVKGTGTPQGPFRESPAEIPGRIEAEDFDLGIPGEAYYDIDAANRGNIYRKRVEVDIQECPEGGYNLGWVADGEWLKYTLNVAENGPYDITFRVSAPEGAGKFHLEMDGEDKTGLILTPQTSGWETYADVVVYNVELKSGRQVMRFVADTGQFNFNYLEFTRSSAKSPRTMYISSILKGEDGGKGKATVTIRDSQGNPVSGAKVDGIFKGTYNENVSGTTDANGMVVLVTKKKAKRQRIFSREKKDFFFYVYEVKHPALSYNPNIGIK